jgi:hypothetical protein
VGLAWLVHVPSCMPTHQQVVIQGAQNSTARQAWDLWQFCLYIPYVTNMSGWIGFRSSGEKATPGYWFPDLYCQTSHPLSRFVIAGSDIPSSLGACASPFSLQLQPRELRSSKTEPQDLHPARYSRHQLVYAVVRPVAKRPHHLNTCQRIHAYPID